jgi:hypothetical protein
MLLFLFLRQPVFKLRYKHIQHGFGQNDTNNLSRVYFYSTTMYSAPHYRKRDAIRSS